MFFSPLELGWTISGNGAQSKFFARPKKTELEERRREGERERERERERGGSTNTEEWTGECLISSLSPSSAQVFMHDEGVCIL